MVSQANQKTGNPKTNRMKVVFRSKPYSPWPPEKWSGPTLGSRGEAAAAELVLMIWEKSSKMQNMKEFHGWKNQWNVILSPNDSRNLWSVTYLLCSRAGISVPNEGGKFNWWSITTVQETTIGIFSKKISQDTLWPADHYAYLPHSIHSSENSYRIEGCFLCSKDSDQQQLK